MTILLTRHIFPTTDLKNVCHVVSKWQSEYSNPGTLTQMIPRSYVMNELNSGNEYLNYKIS
jgi:hypothetical protein